MSFWFFSIFIILNHSYSQGFTFSKENVQVQNPTESTPPIHNQREMPTLWKFRTSSVENNTYWKHLPPLFPPVRSQRRNASVNSHQPTSLLTFNDYIGSEVVEINGTAHDEWMDIIETEEMLEEEIKLLNESLTIFMSQRRPSYTPDGTIQLFPTPNLSFLPDIGALRQLFRWGSRSIGSYAVCHACRVGLGYFLLQARTKATLEDLSPKAIFLCKFFKIANEEVCTGLVSRFGPTVYFILTTRYHISATMFCGIVLQAQGCASVNYLNDWNVDLFTSNEGEVRRYDPTPKSSSNSIVFDDSIPIQTSSSILTTDSKVLKILHLTDIHLDLNYRPGSNAECDTELCCRDSGVVAKKESEAGFYGDYRKCDLPLHSLENALQHISTTHPDIDLIYMTGDLVPHNIWSTDAKLNSEAIHVASALIRKYFPAKYVIPVIGNHDVHPLNLFSPPGVPAKYSTEYIYAATLKEWSDWIPRESYHTFLHAGFYKVQITPTFKVIVLNTNLCYTLNFWQVYEHRDPAGQLKWLVKELIEADSLGQKVHILGHVPPSMDECFSTWSRNFYEIINRFSSTVTSQFYGHTHYDEFQLHYHKVDKGRAINPLWIGTSLTPFVNLNPGYKIFSVDGNQDSESTWYVIDHETWIYDLVEANENPHLPPIWFRLYKATEAYNIPDVLPHSLNEFVHRMSSDLETFKTYYRNYYKGAEASLKGECDKTCRKQILCRIVSPYYFEQRECNKIQSEVDGIILPRQIFQNQTIKSIESSPV